MIEVTELQKNYNGIRALDGLSLRVEPGESVGLVGPNGAGKTTLIKILATLLRADGGSARVSGHDVAAAPEAVRAVIGYLPDVPGLYQDMRVREFLEFFAEAFHLHGGRKRDAIERALVRVHLAERSEAFVEQLSLGMKQKLVVAKTLLHDPKVLLLDEPATGLDPLARIELREQLKQLHGEGATIFVSSHILTDLEDICTRIIFIDHGRIVQAEGAPAGPSAAKTVVCEIEVAAQAERAAEIVLGFAGARVIRSEGVQLLAEVPAEGDRPAALLRELVTGGIPVVRFAPRGVALEERYRDLFSGGKP